MAEVAKKRAMRVWSMNTGKREPLFDGVKIEEKWHNWNPGVELVTLYSPYRLVIQPLLDYISQLEHQKQPEDFITVLIPEFQTKKWWHRLLHNQTGWVLRTLLILKENVIVTTVPFHLKK